MPVVWHHAVREKCDVASSDRLGKDAFKRLVVCSALEKSRTFCGSVDHMEIQTGRGHARASGHGDAYQRKRSAGRATVGSVLIK
jgi:hypothetical protein